MAKDAASPPPTSQISVHSYVSLQDTIAHNCEANNFSGGPKTAVNIKLVGLRLNLNYLLFVFSRKSGHDNKSKQCNQNAHTKSTNTHVSFRHGFAHCVFLV